MTVAIWPFVVARCDVYSRLALDPMMKPWDVDSLLMNVAKRTLHQVYPAMVDMERRIAAAPREEEWQLVSQLFDTWPLGLRIEPAAGMGGIELHIEAGHVSRHDQLLLLGGLEAALAVTTADPSLWPKPALAQFSHIS